MAIEERRKVKSNQVGPATLLSTGMVTTAYRAVVDLTCGVCGQPIRSGALFSRHAPHKGATHLAPACTRCRPLRVPDAGAGQ